MIGDGSPTPTPTPPPIVDLPQVTITPMPGYGVAPMTTAFMVAAFDPQNAGISNYQWNFGDGTVSTLPPQHIFHAYQKPGSYIVTLTVTTTDGRTATALTGVVVRPRAP
jgi:microbial collagenase